MLVQQQQCEKCLNDQELPKEVGAPDAADCLGGHSCIILCDECNADPSANWRRYSEEEDQSQDLDGLYLYQLGPWVIGLSARFSY